jgi:hypothetical protein
MNEPYYKAYEKRYQTVFSAGAKRWGHSPDDEVLYNTLKLWVEENNLQGIIINQKGKTELKMEIGTVRLAIERFYDSLGRKSNL